MRVRTTNPEHLAQVKEIMNRCHFLRLLDVNITALEPNLCRAETIIAEKHMNPFMGMHGGAYAGMMDHIGFWALYATLPEDLGYTTLDLHCDDLRAGTIGDHLTIEGRVLKQGSTISLTEVNITDDAGHLMAHGTSKLFASPTLQPIQAMLDGYAPGTVLPPKFLD